MEARTARPSQERDLRALSTADLLSLIQQDIRELDQIIHVRRRHDVEEKPRPLKGSRRSAQAIADEAAAAAEEVEAPPLHRVACCNHTMGDFPPWAQVRCPFCSTWHKAGDFPRSDG